MHWFSWPLPSWTCFWECVLTGVLAAAALRLRTLMQTASSRPEADAATSELRPESPALAGLLVQTLRVDVGAFTATVLDLATRGVVELVELDDHTDGVRIVADDPAALDSVQRAALDALRSSGHATDGVPIGRLFDFWRRRAFASFVSEAAEDASLVERDRVASDVPVLAPVLALGVLVLVLSGATFNHAFLTGALSVLLAWAIVRYAQRNRRGVYSPIGRRATAHWLGVREYLAADSELCAAPARSVAIWGPYFAYAVAFGLAHPNLRVLAPHPKAVAPRPDPPEPEVRHPA